MSRFRRYLSLLFFAAFLSVASIANARSIEGTYSVKGTNPGGKSSYSGTATISAAENGTYEIHWEVGTVYDGVGTLQRNTFKVQWGNAKNPQGGMITYTVKPNGTLKGSWYIFQKPNVLGSETLTPR